MKKIVIFAVLIVVIFAKKKLRTSYLTLPGEVTAESFDNFNKVLTNGSRIASGLAGKKGENLDLCMITVKFLAKSQSCGCFVYDATHVVTAARCVVDVSEGKASSVVVTFPQMSGNTATIAVDVIYVPDGTNGEAAIEAYSALTEIPSTTIAPNNVAVLTLESALTLDGKSVQKASVVSSESVEEFMETVKNSKYRACGIGIVDNKGTLVKGVMCTDVNPIGASCGDDVENQPEDGLCLRWTTKDNNLCMGDYGGPIWAYVADSKGTITAQNVISISVGSPDTRTGAPCLDAHRVISTYMSTAVKLWIDNIIAGK